MDNIMNIFEKATRLDLRFLTVRGDLNIQQVWQLPLTSRNDPSLNSIGMALVKKIREESGESLLSTQAKTNSNDDLRLDIIKHIISIKEAEVAKKEAQAAIESEKNLINKILENKREKRLEDMSEEELLKYKQNLNK